MRGLLHLAAWLFPSLLLGQYGVGIAGGTYEGVWGLGSQPASMLLGTDKVEINALRFGLDLNSSYFYFAQQQIALFGFGNRVKVNTSEAELATIGTTDRSIGLDLRTMGPSFTLRIGKQSAVAFTTAMRGSFVAMDLDRLARKFGVDTVKIEPGKSRRMEEIALRSATIGWAEFGPAFGHSFPLGSRLRLHAAVSAKYAMGLFADQATIRPPMLSGLDNDVQAITEVSLDHALALPTTTDGIGGWITGNGWNVDAGFVLEVLGSDSSGKARGDYRLRIGAALTDAGSITFNKHSTVSAVRNGATTVDDLNGFSVGGIEQLDTALSRTLLGNPMASRTGTSFVMGLPAAAHFSVDYSPIPHLAVRAEAVLGLRSAPTGATARDQISITPRFETRNLCMAVPISMDRFNRPTVGLALRVCGFMVGSDRIGGLFGLNQVSGADVYFGVKVRLKGRV